MLTTPNNMHKKISESFVYKVKIDSDYKNCNFHQCQHIFAVARWNQPYGFNLLVLRLLFTAIFICQSGTNFVCNVFQTRTQSFQYRRDFNAFKDLMELYGNRHIQGNTEYIQDNTWLYSLIQENT